MSISKRAVPLWAVLATALSAVFIDELLFIKICLGELPYAKRSMKDMGLRKL